MAENPPTPHYNFNLPLVGGDDNAWGGMLNANWSSIDTLLWTVSGVASAALTPALGDARYLTLTGGTLGPNSLIVNGPSQFTNYVQFTGSQPVAFSTQAQFTGGATFGTSQVFFNSGVTFSANAQGVTPPAADNSNLIPTTSWVNTAVSAAIGAIPAAPLPSNAAPSMAGTAAPGAAALYSRGDHVHPTDTSRYAASNPSGYQTAAQVTASLGPYALIASVPVAAATLPLANGVAAIGASTAYARADHVHPTDAYPRDNRIINGDCRIDQRNNGAGGTAVGYTVDRWYYQGTQASKITWQRQNAGAALTALGFGYLLGFTSTSAFTPAATDNFIVFQPIEADMVGDFAWGTASAQPVTLSFWVSSSLTGTFSGAIRNLPATTTRTYPFTYSIPAANTWTKIAVTIPGDTAGTWVMSGNAGALQVLFDLGSGANFRTAGNAWASGNYMGVTGSQSVVSTNGATFSLTGVKLEVGSTATPYNRQSLTKSLADCQRYYQVYGTIIVGSYAAASTSIFGMMFYPVAMRVAPTITPNTVAYTNASGFIINGITVQNARLSVVATAAGTAYATFNATADAEL